MTVTELRKIATDLKIAGRSKMTKSALIAAIDAEYARLYAEAEDMNRERTTAVSEAEADAILTAWLNTINGEAGKPRKSYTERMMSRQCAYTIQRNSLRWTAKQERRYNKKYRQQYGNLLAELGVAS
jgi:hypothetical protein